MLGHPSAPGARNLTDLARTVVGIRPPRRGLLERLGLFRRRALAKEPEGETKTKEPEGETKTKEPEGESKTKENETQ